MKNNWSIVKYGLAVTVTFWSNGVQKRWHGNVLEAYGFLSDLELTLTNKDDNENGKTLVNGRTRGIS